MTKKLTIPNDNADANSRDTPENQDATPEAPINNPDATNPNEASDSARQDGDEGTVESKEVLSTPVFLISPEEKIPSNWGITVHPDDDTLILAVSDLTSKRFEGTREEFSKLLREG